MTESTLMHPAPDRHRVRLLVSMFGICALPLFWLLQEWAGYAISAIVCSNAGTLAMGDSALRHLLFVFDAIALCMVLAGGFVSYRSWRAFRDERQGNHRQALDIGNGRTRFLALWGMLVSLCFFVAVVFATILSSGVVPACAG